MNNLDKYLFTKEHEWLLVDGDMATIGITDFAQQELGDIIFIELPDSDESFNTGDVFGTIEAVKTVADLFMPISGKIVEINKNIEDNPDFVNSEPFGNGWIVKIKIDDMKDITTLLSHHQYKELVDG